MPPEKQMTALMNKDLDAAMVWEPWIQRMVHEANARLIATEGDLGIYTNVACISVQREWRPRQQGDGCALSPCVDTGVRRPAKES